MEEEDEDDEDEEEENKNNNGTESGNVKDSSNDKDIVAMQTDSANPDVSKNIGISSMSAESNSGAGSSSPQQSTDSTQRADRQRIERETEIF